MAKKPTKPEAKPQAKGSDAQQHEAVGFHKGSLMTLSKERAELMRILGIVEQLMQMHAAALQEMGVKVEAEMQPQAAQPTQKPKKPPIEDIL